MLVLPLVPVTATMTAGWRAGETRGDLRETAARLRILDQRARRHARRPGCAGRSEHSDGASRYRIGDEGTAVDATAGQRREQISGCHAAAVGGDAGNFQATRIPPRGRNGTGESLHGNRTHDFSEPQRRAAASAGGSAAATALDAGTSASWRGSRPIGRAGASGVTGTVNAAPGRRSRRGNRQWSARNDTRGSVPGSSGMNSA